jgi:hypothetical protein
MRLEGPAGPIVALDSRCEAKLRPGKSGEAMPLGSAHARPDVA